MSGTAADDPEDRDALAAEFVLGLLDASTHRQVAEAAVTDVELADAIAAWSARLEPLADLAPPSQPSDILWGRIAGDLATAGSPPGPARASRHGVGWKLAAAAGFGLAACLAAFIVSRHRLEIRVALVPEQTSPAQKPAEILQSATTAKPNPVVSPAVSSPPKISAPEQQPSGPKPTLPPKPPSSAARALALLSATGAETPAMKAMVTGLGTIRVEALRPVKVAANKQLDLWVWPHGEQSPTLLGSIAATGGSLPFTAGLVDGTPMMITLEPRDLPNTGQQGPTLFQGQLGLID